MTTHTTALGKGLEENRMGQANLNDVRTEDIRFTLMMCSWVQFFCPATTIIRGKFMHLILRVFFFFL